LGGARSGKSRYAERSALESVLEVVYIATAEAKDEEMAERIEHHRRRRPAGWRSIEEPLELAATLQALASPGRFLLVDCLTLWLSNLLASGEDRWQHERSDLLHALPALAGRICLVSNEVGHGIVPVNPLARRFVDEAGRLHQDLAAVCERVVWMIAGLPQILKGAP
jgi:adenosylcobinamide kinase/adenosylcobinamide-phosphate guanylyltransferase